MLAVEPPTHRAPMPRKPRGINGPVRITAGGPPPEFMPNSLPAAKSGIEKMMVDGALSAQRALSLDIWSLDGEPKQLEEDSFDFELPTKQGIQHLDLVEFAPLTRYKGSYESVPNKHNVGELADAFWSLVKKKSSHYGQSRRARVHLLIYITAFHFLPNESVFRLLELYCRRKSHGFLSVTFYSPIDMESGMVRPLYPATDGAAELSHGDERALRQREFTNMDMRKVRMSDDGHAAFFDPA
jgi:hypothetical protein